MPNPCLTANFVIQAWSGKLQTIPAALATLLTYDYGTPVTEEALTVRAVNDMSRRGKEVVSGLSMLALKNTLAAEGVSATGYKMNRVTR